MVPVRRAKTLWQLRRQKDDEATRVRRFRRRRYPGSRTRLYEIHLPPSYTGKTALPLVMVLHGCRQSQEDIRQISTFDAIADRERFIVVYPYVTAYVDFRIRNCWGWWRESEIRPGAGEVEDLWQIVEEVKAEFNVDPRRIHATGLSSGGSMAVAAMVAHASKLASGAVVAGVPYAETSRAVATGPGANPVFRPIEEVASAMDAVMGDEKRAVPVFIVHSHDDPVVDIQCARNIRDSLARCFEIDTSRRISARAGNTRGTAWVHKKYRGGGRRTAIETLFLEGAGHGWYGGKPGEFSYPDAPNVAERIWEFLKRHPLEQSAYRKQLQSNELRPVVLLPEAVAVGA
ncbi:MAG: PHB depolymerase family esterase [Gammaproteobacteria bacterium]